MLTVRRLLVPTDHGPCAAVAYTHALRLAAVFDAELHLVHAEVATDSVVDEEDVPLPPAPTNLRVVEATIYGSTVVEALLDYVEAHGIDLIVMGTHGRRGLAHLFLGSVAERVVQHASCPVLTVRAPAEAEEPFETPEITPIRRILAPVDFSARSEGALTYAAALAERLGATVDVLHAVDVPALPDVYDVGIIAVTPNLVERSRNALVHLVDRVVPEAHRGEVLVEVNTPAAAILNAACEHEADLIVMATHGLTGLKHFALGSVAERVVQRASCPVLTLKQPGSLPAAPDKEEDGSTVTTLVGEPSQDPSASVL